MTPSMLARLRWERIMPFGYVGQQSFVTAHDVLRAFRGCRVNACWDVGCGCGALSFAIARLPSVSYVLATDIDINLVKSAQRIAAVHGQEGRVKFAFQDINNFSEYPSSTFDAVISCDVLQFSIEPSQVISHLFSNWSGDGPFYASIWCTSDTRIGRKLASAWGFPSPFPYQSLVEAIQRSGTSTHVVENQSRFRLYADRSRESLLAYQHEYAAHFGVQALEARLKLEAETCGALNSGHITHAIVRSDG